MTTFSGIGLGAVPEDNNGSGLRDGGVIINDNFDLAANKTEENTFEKAQVFDLFISLGAPELKTIASGLLTIGKSNVAIIGEGDASDDLDTINMTGGNVDGTVIIVKKGGRELLH